MQSRRLVWCSVLVVLVWLWVPPAARAYDDGPDRSRVLELVWEAPPECPNPDEVWQQVDALLPRDVELRRGLQATGRVSQGEDGRWLLHLTLVAEGVLDDRDLVGDSCQALADSAAVIMAMQLTPTHPKPLPQRDEPHPTPVRPKDSPRPAPPRSFFQLGLSGSADSAALPRLALGARADLGFSRARFYLGVSAALWLGQTETLAPAHPGQGRFGWRAASLWTCHATWGGAVRLGPCLAFEVGQLTARSSDVRSPGAVSELWVAALGGGAFWVPLGSSWLLTSSVSAAVPLRRPSFVVEGIGEIHQPRAIGVRSALGLAWRF